MRELKPFDYVLTNKGVLMMVKNYEERDRAIIASPKYIPRRYIKDSFRDKVWVMLGDKWSRVNNPLEEEAPLSDDVLKYLRDYEQIAPNQFVISRRSCNGFYVCENGAVKLIEGDNGDANNIRKSASKLISIIMGGGVPLDNIGITGSVLFGGEMENFSDIDLVIYGSTNYEKATEAVRRSTNKGLRFRTPNAWHRFYSEYRVKCALNEDEFANHMANKADQFFINGIPVSIFAVRDNTNFIHLDNYRTSREVAPQRIKMDGKIEDCSESMFLPGLYIITDSEDKRRGVFSNNRAFVSQVSRGDKVEVSGLVLRVGDENDWIVIDNEGFIKQKHRYNFPYLVARNMAFSHPFISGDVETEEPILRVRKDDLSTVFDPRTNLLFELNGCARIIYEGVKNGNTMEEIRRNLFDGGIEINDEEIQSFHSKLKSCSLIK